jgi:ATP-dependent Clp protease protease subunit
MSLPPIQQQLLQQPRPPAFISFSAEITPPTVEQLLGSVTGFVNQGFREIHLMLSTPGGSVMHGVNAYNVLRGLPITLITHNVGNVDSIGTVIFLAGERRYACPQATFMLHGVAFNVMTPMSFFEKNISERLESVRSDQRRIMGIYQERAGISEEEGEGYFLRETNLTATEAREKGIIHEVRPVQIPEGSPVLQLVFNRK